MPIFYFVWMRNKLLLCLGLCIWGFTYLVVKSFYNSWTFGSLLKLQLLLKLHQVYNMGGIIYWASLVAQMVKNLPATRETWVGKIPWRRALQPTPVFLPGEFHGQRSLAGYSPWSRKESDMTEWLSTAHDIYAFQSSNSRTWYVLYLHILLWFLLKLDDFLQIEPAYCVFKYAVFVGFFNFYITYYSWYIT